MGAIEIAQVLAHDDLVKGEPQLAGDRRSCWASWTPSGCEVPRAGPSARRRRARARGRLMRELDGHAVPAGPTRLAARAQPEQPQLPHERHIRAIEAELDDLR